MNKIIQGDCLEKLKELADNSVDMVLCDLPYGTTSCSWDEIIPFTEMWEQLNRIVKDNGAMIFTASQPFTSKLVMSNIKMFRHSWIWKKNKGSNFALLKYQPFKEHEDVLVFSKKTCKYFPIKEERAESGKSRVKYDFMTKGGGEFMGGSIGNETDRRVCEELRFPSSVQKFNTQQGLHPTQKPVDLFEYLIKTYSNENDVVLDFCAGSGTTGVACKNLNRNYILIEKEDKYVEIIKNRLK